MNANQAKEWLPFVQAVADGKTIQIDMCGEWVDISDISGYFERGVENLRIKPKKFKSFSLPWEYIDKRWNFATYSALGGIATIGIIVCETRPSLGVLGWTGGGMATYIPILTIDEDVNELDYLACRNPENQ